MVTIDVLYEGDLHCQAMHGPSGATLNTDAPADNKGKGESFSPTDLVATSIGTCMVTIMGIAAEEHGLELAGTRVRVDKHMVADPRRRIGRLDVSIDVPRELDAASRELLEAAAFGCPVKRSLDPAVEVNVTFRWGGQDAGRP